MWRERGRGLSTSLAEFFEAYTGCFSCIYLRHYVSDPTHVIDMSSLHVSDEGALMTEPVRIFIAVRLTVMTSNGRSGQGPVGQL